MYARTHSHTQRHTHTRSAIGISDGDGAHTDSLRARTQISSRDLFDCPIFVFHVAFFFLSAVFFENESVRRVFGRVLCFGVDSFARCVHSLYVHSHLSVSHTGSQHGFRQRRQRQRQTIFFYFFSLHIR